MRVVGIVRHFNFQCRAGGERIPRFDVEVLAEMFDRKMAQRTEPDPDANDPAGADGSFFPTDWPAISWFDR